MKPFSFLIRASLVLLISSSFFGCSFFFKNKVILKINSQEWTNKDYASLLAKKINSFNRKDIHQDSTFIEKLKEEVVVDLLISYLIQKWAKNHQVSISKKELENKIQKIKDSFPSEEVFNLYLKRKKASKTEWKQLIKQKLLTERVIEKMGTKITPPAETEMLSYYEGNKNLFKQRASLLIHHIFHKQRANLVKVHKEAGKTQDLLEASEKFLQEAYINPRIRVEKGSLEVFDQAFKLKVKEISPIWKSPYGYHLIQVLEKKTGGQMSFKQAQNQIQKGLISQKRRAVFTKWLDEASKKVEIWQDEEAMDKIKVRLL